MIASSLAGLIWFQFGATITFLVSAFATLLVVLYIITIPKPETMSNEVTKKSSVLLQFADTKKLVDAKK